MAISVQPAMQLTTQVPDTRLPSFPLPNPNHVLRACLSSTSLPEVIAIAVPTTEILAVNLAVSRQLLLLMSRCTICAEAEDKGIERLRLITHAGILSKIYSGTKVTDMAYKCVQNKWGAQCPL